MLGVAAVSRKPADAVFAPPAVGNVLSSSTTRGSTRIARVALKIQFLRNQIPPERRGPCTTGKLNNAAAKIEWTVTPKRPADNLCSHSASLRAARAECDGLAAGRSAGCQRSTD